MYPFGLAHNQNPQRELSNKYLYNGKELQIDLGLNWLDYGAHFYQPDLGRWGVVDPMSEFDASISTYSYVRNNPLRYNDPTGMFAVDGNKRLESTFVAPDGTILDVRDDGDNNIYLIHSLADWNPTGGESDKEGLAVIGHTPEPATLKNHRGQNIYTQEVYNFMFSEADRVQKSASLISRDHFDGMIELMKSRDMQLELLKTYRMLMIKQMWLALKLIQNGESQILLEEWKKGTYDNVVAETALKLLAFRYGGASSVAQDIMIDQLQKEIQAQIDQHYEEGKKEIKSKHESRMKQFWKNVMSK